MSDYTPTTEEVRVKYRLTSGIGMVDAHNEFDRWLAEVELAAAEKAWDEGFSRGFYRGQILSGDYDASEAGISNPYRRERGGNDQD